MKTELEVQKEALPLAAIVLYHALDDPYVSVAEIATASLKPVTAVLPKGVGRHGVSLADVKKRLTPMFAKPFTTDVASVKAEIQLVLEAKEDEVPPPDSQS